MMSKYDIPEGNKVCSLCKEEKELKEYYWYTHKGREDPHPMSECKQCCKANNAKRKAKEGYREHENALRVERRKDPKYVERVRASNIKAYHKFKYLNMYKAAQYRAKRKGMDFDIELSDIAIPEYCPILGIKLEAGTAKVYENSPSLDRIDNSKGYIKGNVMVMSKKANSMKNSASFEELRLFCTKMLEICAIYDIVQPVENGKPTELADKEPLG